MLSKNVNNKKCAPNLIFFNEKKMRKIQIIFDIENWLWKSNFGQNFGTFDTSPLTQFSKFNNFLWECWFLGKNISNFVPPAWNSTTRIAIIPCHNVQQGHTIHYFWVQKKGMLRMYLGCYKIFFDWMSSPDLICAALPIRRCLKEF